MVTMQPSSRILPLLLLLLIGLLAACGQDDGPKATDAGAPTVATAAVSAAPTTSASAGSTTTTASSAASADGAGGAPDAPPITSGSAPPPPPRATTSAKPPSTAKAPSPSTSSTGGPAVAPPPATTTAAPAPPPAPTVAVEPAKPGSADEVAAKIDAIFGPAKRFKADFKQEYRAKVQGTTKKSTGVLWVEKPGKLSLKYAKPNNNRAVSDGVVLKVFEHENKQMFLKDVKNTEYPGAFAFILGKGLRSSFTFEFNEKTKWEGGPVIVGTPRIPNPGYKKVLFYIDEELLKHGDLGAVRRVLVLDAQGNRNQFDFIQALQPDSIPATEFIFEPPAGTEIIKG